jgi:hypothetical protein
MQRSVWPFIVATLLATPAAAQVRTTPAPATPAPVPRGFVNINGGYQVSSNDFGDTSTFRLNAEDGRLDTDYTVQSGPTIDVAGGATVWRQTPPPGSGAGAAGWQIAAGVGVTRFSRSTPLAIDASVPHPFFFNRQRSVAGEIGGLERSELAVHVQGRAVVPMRGPVQVMIFGGPSFFRVDQDLVSEVSYAEEYPYDTAGLGQTVSTRASESTIGYNVGADVAYFFSRQLGVGGTIQAAGATVRLPAPGGGTVDAKAGGLQAGGGLRVRF